MSNPELRPDQPQSSRRDQILDECLFLAGQRGYHGFSLQDLAERCKLTKQGVLHYFPSKDRLLLALLDERDASIEADLLGLLSSGGFEVADSPEASRAIFRESLARVIEHMAAAPDLIRLHVVLRAEAINSEHPASAYFLQRDRATLAWLAERAAPFCEHAVSTSRQILALMIGLQQQWLQEDRGFDLAAEWRCALAILLPATD
jgi:AcrR family transcriptional regulator